MINRLRPWDDATADAAIDLMRAQTSPMTNSTRNLEPEVSIVDSILAFQAALDKASDPVGMRWFYCDGHIQQKYVYPRDFYRGRQA